MAKKIDRLGATLGKLLRARGLEGRLSEYRILGRWEQTVGAAIALHAQPRVIRAKKLTIVVDSPAWMQQLSLLKPELIRKLNNALGKDAVRDITLKLGEVEVSRRATEERESRVALTDDDRMKIERHIHDVGDAETREVLRRVLGKDLLSRKRTGK